MAALTDTQLRSKTGQQSESTMPDFNFQPPKSNLQPPAFYLKPKITLPDDFRLKLLSGSSDEDSLLEEAFAVVREASKRVLGMRHFDCQMVGEALF